MPTDYYNSLGNLSGDCDRYKIDNWGRVWVRSLGLYSGGETSGQWQEVGGIDEPELMAAVDDEIGVRPAHRAWVPVRV